MKTHEEIKEILAEARKHGTEIAFSLVLDVCDWLVWRAECGRKPKVTDTTEHDYTSWDWTKSNGDLAKQYNIAQTNVSAMRRKLGKPKVWKYASLDTGGWDWKKTNTELAREHHLGIAIVSDLRHRGGHQEAEKKRVRGASFFPKQQDYRKLDWTKYDAQLANEIGVTRERVRQIRVQLGIPKSTYSEKCYHDFVKAAAGRKLLHREDVQEMGFNYTPSIVKYCERAGIELVCFKRPNRLRHPWHLVNWRLPDGILQEVWELSTNLSATRRGTKRMPAAAYDLRHKQQPSSYEREVEAERAKAAAWRAEQACKKHEKEQKTAQEAALRG